MGGGIFFPYDPMTEKVRNMRKYRIYSEEAFQMAFKKDAFNLPILAILKEANDKQ